VAPRAAAGSSGQLLGAEAEANGGAAGRAPASGAPGSRGDGACARPAAELLRASARLYLARQGGVERVFVGHPLFDAADGDIYGAAAAATYLEGDALPDLHLRYSVLCQARRLLREGPRSRVASPRRSRAALCLPNEPAWACNTAAGPQPGEQRGPAGCQSLDSPAVRRSVW